MKLNQNYSLYCPLIYEEVLLFCHIFRIAEAEESTSGNDTSSIPVEDEFNLDNYDEEESEMTHIFQSPLNLDKHALYFYRQ